MTAGTNDPIADPVLEELDRAECLALIATETVGRLAVNWAGGPLVVPVNYVLVGETIVFRSGAGTKLRALGARPVSFQVDRFDPRRREGWSVLARGRAHEVSGRQHSAVAVDPWVPRNRDHWVVMRIASVTGRRVVGGRRFAPAPGAADGGVGSVGAGG